MVSYRWNVANNRYHLLAFLCYNRSITMKLNSIPKPTKTCSVTIFITKEKLHHLLATVKCVLPGLIQYFLRRVVLERSSSFKENKKQLPR